MTPQRRRVVVWCAAALPLLVGGAWLSQRGSLAQDAGWVEVRRGDLRLDVEISGTLKAVDAQSVGPPQINDLWDYKIAKLAPEGSEVKTGDPVLGFDTTELERRLEEKRAEADAAQKEIEKREIDLEIKRRDDDLRLAEAEARKRKAQLKVEVPESLAQEKELATQRIELALAAAEIEHLRAKTDADREAAEADLASFRERRDRARQRVHEIEAAIESMTIKAPRDGTVVYVSNWREEKKKVGDSCWRGEKVLEIPDLNRMEAEGEVDEADAGRIAEGQTVRFRLDAHPDVDFTGRVRSIWGTVQRKSWRNPLKVVRLAIDLDATDARRMRPGMRFTGSLETGRVAAAVVVPSEAVFPTPDGPVAFRETSVGFEPVRLKLGQRNAKEVEVLAGLSEGDRVARKNLAQAAERT